MYTIIIILSIIISLVLGLIIGGVIVLYAWSIRLVKKLQLDGYNEANIIDFMSKLLVMHPVGITLASCISIMSKVLNLANHNNK